MSHVVQLLPCCVLLEIFDAVPNIETLPPPVPLDPVLVVVLEHALPGKVLYSNNVKNLVFECIWEIRCFFFFYRRFFHPRVGAVHALEEVGQESLVVVGIFPSHELHPEK